MVTGSHIPADRNGIKFNKCSGEILKRDEALMMAQRVDYQPDVSIEPLPAEDARARRKDAISGRQPGATEALVGASKRKVKPKKKKSTTRQAR